ncbi:DUF2125 domain-containing protein [Pyruvatibacter sp.]|uniref:DUF2125 domain-containing protein n=1 Tax=Pyruvatibacter sp. TaxID=1981328 RepID=UPI0032ECE08B
MLNRLPKTALPLLALLVLTGLYWLYWSTLADRLKTDVAAWAQAQAANGVTITWSDMRARGWPLRLRLELDDLRYEASQAQTPWAWSTPEFHAHALPYRLTHIIASAQSPMRFETLTGPDKQQWEIVAGSTEASYVFEEGTAARLAIDIQMAKATRLDRPDASTLVGANRFQVHARRAEDVAGAANIAVRASGISLDKDLAPGLVDILGPTIAHVGIQSRVTANAGDAVFRDLALLRLRGSEIQVSQGTVTWGTSNATGTGKLDIAPDGTPDGRFDTTLSGYDTIIEGLVRQGLVEARLEGTLKAAMSLLSLTSGAQAGSVRVPVIVRAGDVYLGPVRVSGATRTP